MKLALKRILFHIASLGTRFTMRSKIVLSVLICSCLAECISADENASSAVISRNDSRPVGRANTRLSYPQIDEARMKQARQMSGIHFYPGSPVYDSLLTRRTFVPSFRMVLLELSLMTLGVFVMNAVENMIHAGPKPKRPQPVKKPQPPKKRYRRMLYERHFSSL